MLAAMGNWPVQDAKARFSELMERASTDGPQTITRDGAERAVLLLIEDYRALIARKPDFKAHLLGGPKLDDFAVERDADASLPVIDPFSASLGGA
jgi:prevent-host-death family protein